MEVKQGEPDFFNVVQFILSLVMLSLMAVATVSGSFIYFSGDEPETKTASLVSMPPEPEKIQLWQPPDSTLIPATAEGELIRYGRALIVHTSRYLGPRGSVQNISNGLNCQNCHLKAGMQPFGNNFAAVSSTYPKFRKRSGGLESIEKRINDCLERSLNGKPLDNDSREMRAMIAWFEWLGQDVPKDSVPPGTSVPTPPFLSRAADPVAGGKTYEKHCKSCHGIEGRGLMHPDGTEWVYPPLAGSNSYNTAAGMLRLSSFAAYVKNNMPFGTTYDKPVLSDEEAWDVAAYINSLPRPVRFFSDDWPDLSAKPFDHPFGPYADTFSEVQHKYGPFAPLTTKRKQPLLSDAR